MAALRECRGVTTTFSIGPVGKPVHFAVRDVFLHPGVASHQLELRVAARAPWLEASDPHAWETILLEGRVAAGSPSRPLGFIPGRVLNIRGYETVDTFSAAVSDDQLLQMEV